MDELVTQLHNDFPRAIKMRKEFPFRRPSEAAIDNITMVSIDMPEQGIYHLGLIWPDPAVSLENLLHEFDKMKKEIRNTVEVELSLPPHAEKYSVQNSIFTNTVFLYTNDSLDITGHTNEEARRLFEEEGYKLRIRDMEHREAQWESKDWDVFISHDSDDSEIASAIYEGLFKRGIKGWLDDVELQIGDSLTEKIDEGMQKSDYGILIVSPSLVDNVGWASGEWQSLRSKAHRKGEKAILPVWYNISSDEVGEFSHWLAEKHAVKISGPDDVDEVVEEVRKTVND